MNEKLLKAWIYYLKNDTVLILYEKCKYPKQTYIQYNKYFLIITHFLPKFKY